jgi:hypothetical protein
MQPKLQLCCRFGKACSAGFWVLPAGLEAIVQQQDDHAQFLEECLVDLLHGLMRRFQLVVVVGCDTVSIHL